MAPMGSLSVSGFECVNRPWVWFALWPYSLREIFKLPRWRGFCCSPSRKADRISFAKTSLRLNDVRESPINSRNVDCLHRKDVLNPWSKKKQRKKADAAFDVKVTFTRGRISRLGPLFACREKRSSGGIRTRQYISSLGTAKPSQCCQSYASVAAIPRGHYIATLAP